jgi:signal peptidase I
MRALRLTADALLTVAAVVGVLGLLLFIGVRLGAVQPLIVTSGSMQPVYETGDMVISRPVDADTLEVGDIATLPDARGRLITHRVVAIEPAADAPDGTFSVQMKGDANDAADPRPYVVTSGLVPIVTIPSVGPAVATVQRPSVAVPALIGLAALIAIAFVPSGHARPEETDAEEAGTEGREPQEPGTDEPEGSEQGGSEPEAERPEPVTEPESKLESRLELNDLGPDPDDVATPQTGTPHVGGRTTR